MTSVTDTDPSVCIEYRTAAVHGAGKLSSCENKIQIGKNPVVGTDFFDICRSIFFAFAGRNKALLELTSKKMNLEDVFIELTESGVEEE